MKGQADPGTPGGQSVPSPLTAEQALGIIARIYQAAMEPDPWPKILQILAPVYSTNKAAFINIDLNHPRESITRLTGIDERHRQALSRRSTAGNHLWQASGRLPSGSTFVGTELMSEERMRNDPLYADVAVPAGLEFVVGAVLENRPEQASVICFMRASENFDSSDKSSLQLILPHLQTALLLSRRLAAVDAARSRALRFFDRARQPFVILDRSGFAIYTNEQAKVLLQHSDGIRLKLGRFLFDSISIQGEFERVVRLALAVHDSDIAPQPTEVRVPRSGTGAPYALSVIPVDNSSDRALLPEGAGCLVLIHDLQSVDPLPATRLAWLYRLTPAEMRICESLYRGGSVDSVADDLNLTRNTVRSHLKSIYSKFGVTTQGQLMKRLTQSARLAEGVVRHEGLVS